MLRLVLDTNVWLDWLVFDDPGIALVRATVATGDAEIVINAECESELIRVLGYPLQKWTLDTERQSACIAQSRLVARPIETTCNVVLPDCEDVDDQKFLELAAAADAHYLLSKDRALLVLNRRHPPLPFHIVTPAEFAARSGVESPNRALPHAT